MLDGVKTPRRFRTAADGERVKPSLPERARRNGRSVKAPGTFDVGTTSSVQGQRRKRELADGGGSTTS